MLRAAIGIGRLALVALLGLAAVPPASAATFTVTNTADSGAGSLRQAITDANAAAGADSIVFAIPAATDPGCVVATGVCTIVPASQLPTISDAVVLDGYTQTGASPNTNTVASRLGLNGALKIVLQGPAGGDGIKINSGGVTVRGLVVRNFFFGIDIVLSGGGTVTLEGNYVGTDVTGATAAPNTSAGIRAGGASGTVVIGGTTAAARNLVSGQSSGPGIFIYTDVAATIQGNLIGTTASGLAGLPNVGGISAAPTTSAIVVGGTAPGAGNLISRNGTNLLITGSANHVVQGNMVGPDVTGSALLGPLAATTGVGVLLRNASTSLIGGPSAAARNIVSGNNSTGIIVENIVGTVGPGNNRVEGNFVGTALDGTTDLGNGGVGVNVGGSPGTVIGGTAAGTANVIAFTKAVGLLPGAGVVIGAGTNQSVLGNSIHSNTGLGIDISRSGAIDGVNPNDPGDADTGANDLQNFPVVTANVVGTAATVSGTLNSTANATFRIELFANAACDASGNGEGRTLIGSTNVTTDGAGNAAFGPLALTVPAGQAVVTATATTAAGSTSEFSQCSAGPPPPGATTTALVSSLNPSTLGQAVTFTATVAGTSPTGTVQFLDGATVLGTVALAGTSATLTTSSLALGSHPITAAYSGDADDAASTSNVVNQLVIPAAPPPPQAPSTPIPTLSEWMLLLLALVLATLAGARLRRRE